MIPYGRQNLNRQDRQAVTRVLKSDFLTQGPQVPKFETVLAKKVGARYAVATANGTAALHVAYLAASLGVGDEVITTPNTFVATANMLLAVGAKLVFCDIRLDTYNLDETKIEKLITKRTRAIVTVDFAGQPSAVDTLRGLARRYGLILISDSSHALGARHQDQPVGSLADLTTFSFHPVKSITTGEGGAVVTNNKTYYKKLLHLRSHGIRKNKSGFNVMTDLGYNYRLTDLQAALGASQLVRLDDFIRRRRQVVIWYQQSLAGVDGIILPQELPENYSAWHLYVVRVTKPSNRLPLMQYLKKNGVGVNFHYPAIYRQPYYRRHGYQRLALPQMEQYHHTAITVPLHTRLSKKEVYYIAQLIKKFFATR